MSKLIVRETDRPVEANNLRLTELSKLIVKEIGRTVEANSQRD